jgi:hypothetical protein
VRDERCFGCVVAQFFRPHGAGGPLGFDGPPLKRWAIFGRPCGTGWASEHFTRGAGGPLLQPGRAKEPSLAIYRWVAGGRETSPGRDERTDRLPRQNQSTGRRAGQGWVVRRRALGGLEGAQVQAPVRLAQEGEHAASVEEVGIDDLLGKGLDKLGVHAAGQVFFNAVSFANVQQHARVYVEPQGSVFVGLGADQREAGVDAVRFVTVG